MVRCTPRRQTSIADYTVQVHVPFWKRKEKQHSEEGRGPKMGRASILVHSEKIVEGDEYGGGREMRGNVIVQWVWSRGRMKILLKRKEGNERTRKT